MTITPETDGATVLTVSGDVDVAVADELRDAGVAALRSGEPGPLCLDLAAVSFLDSTGISALVTLRNVAASAKRELVLRNPSPPVAKVLALTALDRVFALQLSS